MGAGRAVVGELELALALGRCALERFRVEGGEIDRSVDALRQADLPAPGSGAHAGPAQR